MVKKQFSKASVKGSRGKSEHCELHMHMIFFPLTVLFSEI